MGQRQITDVSVLRLELGDVQNPGHAGNEVLVGKHYTLRRSGGPRCVPEKEKLVSIHFKVVGGCLIDHGHKISA